MDITTSEYENPALDAVSWMGSRLQAAQDARDLVRDRVAAGSQDLRDAREVAMNIGGISTAVLVGGLLGMRNGIDVASVIATIGGAHMAGKAVGIYVQELLSILEKNHDTT